MRPESGQPSARPPSCAMRSRYDDDDDFGNRNRLEDAPTNAGMIGFILAMTSLGFVVVVAVLWYAMKMEDQQLQNPERTRVMLIWFMILDIVSFCIALSATIFAGLGLSPRNPLYRGWALTGLLLGIFEMIFTAVAALFLTCCVALAG